MKKTLSLFLASCMALLVFGASAAGYEVLLDSVEDTYVKDDTPLVTFRATFPQMLAMEDTDIMDRVNHGIQDTVRDESDYAALCDAADEVFSEGAGDFSVAAYSATVEAETKLSTDALFTVLYGFTLYTGGAHGDDWYIAEQYDLSTGDLVAVRSMVTDPDAFHARAAELLLSEIQTQNLHTERGYVDEYESVVADFSMDQAYFGEEGLVIFFNPYEIAAYVEGMQAITLPMDSVAEFLNDFGRGLLGA